MKEKKSENGQMENGKGGKKGGNFLRLAPLMNLWPAALVTVLIVGTLPFTKPVLREIPALLTIDAQASETKAVEETEAEVQTESNAQGDFEDGIYKGTGTGYGGVITVEVKVENRSIVSVTILSAPGETASFLKRAEAVIDSVIRSQSWKVDVVSGATYSSKGILAAVQNALTGEKTEAETAPVQETKPVVEEVFEEPEGYVDGTYYGSARGFGGSIQVKVLISEGKIADISIVSASGETPSYLSSAKAVISRMIAAQSPNVDTVSGATYSSNGIINAVKIALKQAAGSGVSDDLTIDENHVNAEDTETLAGNASSPQKKPSVNKNPVSAEEGYADGVYTGTAEGFGGDITVQVTIAGGKIAAVEILQAEDETPSYLKQAQKVIERIIAAQSTEVDVISGATWSSTGIINAVSDALSKAVPEENKNPEADQKPQTGSENTQDQESESTQQPEDNTENSGSGSCEEAGTNDPDQTDSENGSGEETDAVLYKDGVYQASALCADEDTFIYTVQVTAAIEEGKIADIKVEKLDDRSDYPEDNDVYLDYAINGRTRKNIWYEGVVKQILTAQSAAQIDVVSSATYSSNAIINAAQEALQEALEKAADEIEDSEMQETVEETESMETLETEETEDIQEPEAAQETDNSGFSVFNVLEDFIIRRFLV